MRGLEYCRGVAFKAVKSASKKGGYRCHYNGCVSTIVEKTPSIHELGPLMSIKYLMSYFDKQ